jgi:transcriptional regulator with XRE-family HTH domain
MAVTGSFMDVLNIQSVYSVNTHPAYWVADNSAVDENRPGPKTRTPASPFWQRLMQAIDANRTCDLPRNPTALARRLKLSQTAVRNWYVGPVLPSRETLIDLARVTGVSADWLETGRLPMYPTGAPADEFQRAVLELLREMPEGERARALEYLRFKAEHNRKGWPATEQEAVDRMKSETGSHKKLS